MSDSGKGDTRRPTLIDPFQFAENWDRTFSRKVESKDLEDFWCSSPVYDRVVKKIDWVQEDDLDEDT